MKTNFFTRTIFIAIILSVYVTSHAQPIDSSKILRVGVVRNPPFVICDNSQFSGISVDLWKKISDSLKIKYELKEYKYADLLKALESSELDISIAPIVVTSKLLTRLYFSQPFYITSLAVALPVRFNHSMLKYLFDFFSKDFLIMLLVVLSVTAIFSFLVWIVERKNRTEIFNKGMNGFGESLWWAIVTLTTVGYGDIAPKTKFGRLISGLWMFISIIIVSIFTASVASHLTVHNLQTEIKDISDISDLRIGSIDNTGSSNFLINRGLNFINYPSVYDGLNAVNKNEINAFVFDQAILDYYLTKYKLNEKIEIIKSGSNKEYFSYSSANPVLIRKINPVLIKIVNSKEWNNILNKYHLEYSD
ncbi:MAG: transporter substrate-binding domain-containing protein [Bacteroidales bacterium]|nr:transporter substrate-binding domain-containing protein [Bacteroidales bacterium]